MTAVLEGRTGGGEAMPLAEATAEAPARTAAALAVKGLSHSFGPRKVLDDVAFEVRPGEFTVLLGPNGAGKTTLFSLMTRLYDHRSGSIRIFGRELKADPSAALARMGVVFQQPTLDLDLSIEQNLSYHAALHGLPRREAAARIARTLDRIGLADRRGEKARRLSGGQRRRVEIGRALLHGPDLLLLDEPTVGLDVPSRQFLIDHVRALCRSEGLAALWATHLLDEVDEGARIIILHRGRVVARGTADEVREQAGGAPDLRAAFDALTRPPPSSTADAPRGSTPP
jgi:ABC-2 type transport system ATP-binding protein